MPFAPRTALAVSAAGTALAAAALLGAPGCSSSHNGAAGGDDAGAADAPTGDGLAPPPITRSQPESQLAPQRAACAFKAGAWPAETIGTDYPVGADIPINHVIVIMQENRSFDHYLGRLVAQGYYKAGDFTEGDGGVGEGFAHSDELDVPPAGWSNPDGDGGVVVPHPDTENCYGVDHSWMSMRAYYDEGRMDGFVRQNNPDGQRTFFYEDDTVIPFYYALASTFSVGDRYFASVPSSTWPNRLYLMAATSFGVGDNSFVTVDTMTSPVQNIMTLLLAGGHTWKDYTDGPHMTSFFPTFGFQQDTIDRLGTVKCTLMNDIANGTLPDVSLVMGDEVDENSDEGPSALPGIGGQLVEQIIRNLWASPSWKDTAVFITYDENGGLADHVRPAPACEPDSYPPRDEKSNVDLPGKFDMTGFRVPFIVVSPYAKAHFASHVVHDHSSITRFIETRFGLPALTARDANALPPMEMFDFKNPPFMTPPTIAAHTTVPADVLARCGQKLAPLACGQ